MAKKKENKTVSKTVKKMTNKKVEKKVVEQPVEETKQEEIKSVTELLNLDNVDENLEATGSISHAEGIDSVVTGNLSQGVEPDETVSGGISGGELDEEPQNKEEDIEPEKIIEEFNNATKHVDELININTTQEELKATLEHEVQHAQETETKLEERIKKLEKNVKTKVKQNFAKFWMGSSNSWFN